MKTERYAFLFTKEEVLQYSELSGVENPIFHSLEAAQEARVQGDSASACTADDCLSSY